MRKIIKIQNLPKAANGGVNPASSDITSERSGTVCGFCTSKIRVKISLISLGCPKNLVDSEIILGLSEKAGMDICENTEDADVLLLNTCAFIKEAKEESIDLIFQLIDLKKHDPNKKIIVVGCLVQRYLKELLKKLPEVDLWVTLQEISNIPTLINNLIKGDSKKYNSLKPIPESFLPKKNTPRHIITPKHYAYIKIAEGCSNLCTYCAVPKIKGRYKSKEIDCVINEAQELASSNIKELNIIAQDTTNYGIDLSGNVNIAILLQKLCGIHQFKWIRLLYTHPAHITDNLIDQIATQDKICKYIDLPLQHINSDILQKMGRKTDSAYIKTLINKIRDKIPGVVIRTSFIIGFPGETKKQFEELLDFMQEIRFERLGIFKYSREEDTKAYNMPKQIPEKIKGERFHKAMSLQNSIAREVNKKFMDKEIDVLLEARHDSSDKVWIGRTYADAPEVDGQVYIHGHNLNIGDIIRVKITDTLDYDLVGKPVIE